MAIITISRQAGSLGDEIAKAAAEKLQVAHVLEGGVRRTHGVGVERFLNRHRLFGVERPVVRAKAGHRELDLVFGTDAIHPCSQRSDSIGLDKRARGRVCHCVHSSRRGTFAE